MASVAKRPGTARGTAEEGPAAEAKSGLASALTVDTEKVRGHLDEVVRTTVEQTLNRLLDEEAGNVLIDAHICRSGSPAGRWSCCDRGGQKLIARSQRQFPVNPPAGDSV